MNNHTTAARRTGATGLCLRAIALCLAALAGAASLAAGPAANTPAPVPAANQLPSGGQVVAGQAQITQNAATAGTASMTVRQDTLRAVIDWQQFNLGSGAQLRFDQPGAQAVTLNRVVGGDASQIMGRISAPGQVFISNPQGVLFGSGASVDVGGLVATTMGISNADFMAGKAGFSRNGSTASVVNQGALTADLHGYIALLAPEVRNEGVVTAQAGTAVLAAGEAITLNFGTPGRLSSITVTPAQIATLVDNRRAVLVPGGQIILSARSAEQLMGSVVNSGELNATSLVQRGGRIVLEGDDITLASSSRIEARGTSDGTSSAAGGTVLVGGDWQGSGAMHQATQVTMAAGAQIDVSATGQGDGGKAVLWADVHNPYSLTTARGSIVARGGLLGGNGGQVETSAYTLDTTGVRVDAGAAPGGGGTGGLWLIDPADTTITQSIANGYAATLNTGTSVLNDVAGTITWNSGVSLSKTAGGDATLTLRTGGAADNRNILLDGATITSSSGALNLVLWTRFNALGNSGKVAITNSSIATNGGDVWVGGGNATTWNGLAVGNDRAATWATDDQGITLRNTSISTGAGNIAMAGLSHASSSNTGVRNFGLLVDSGSSLATTSGGIALDGELRGQYASGAGLLVGTQPSQQVAGSISITSGSGAISLTGTGQDQAGSGSGWRHAVLLKSTFAGDVLTVRSGSGAITVTGTAAFGSGGDFTNDTSGVQLQTNDPAAAIKVVSSSGAIQITGTNTQQASQYENGLRIAASDAANNIRIGYDGVTPSSSNVLIQGDSILQRTQQTGAGSIAVQTTGSLVIAPVSASFTALRADTAGTLSFDNDWNFGSTLGSFTLGKAGSTTSLTLSNALTTAGPINLLGGDVALNANLTTTALRAGDITVKASGSINHPAGVAVATNGSNVVYWADTDGNNSGAIALVAGTSSSKASITTAGGGVWMGGGSGTTSWTPYASGTPLTVGSGYAYAGTGTNYGVDLGDYSIVNAGAGNVWVSGRSTYTGGSYGVGVRLKTAAVSGNNIVLRGIGSPLSGSNSYAWGVGLESASSVTAAGQVDITGTGGGGSSTGSNNTGVYVSGSSIATTTGALNITGTGGGGSGGSSPGVQLISGATVSATSGQITITATGGSAGTDNDGLSLANGTNSIATTTGGVAITATQGAGASSEGLAFDAGSGTTTIGASGQSGNTSILASNVWVRTSSSGQIAGSGSFTLAPLASANSFSYGVDISNLSFASTLTGLTLGKPTNTADLTLGQASIAGPISLTGGSITLNGNLTSTAAGAALLVKATSNIVTASNRTLQTNGGAITLWSDSDASGQGFILLNEDSTLDSRTAADRTAGTYNTATGGGKITLAGGADNGSGAPAGRAAGDSSNTERGGVNFGDQTSNGHTNNTQIWSGGGDVVLRGTASNGYMGINWVDGGTINAGSTGLINLDGVNNGTGHGIELGSYAANGSTIVLRSGGGTGGPSGTPAITINGNTTSSNSNHSGTQSANLTLLATGAGGIAITGSATSGGYGYNGAMDFLSASGAISVNGGAAGVRSTGGTLGQKAATAVTASTSNVTLSGGVLVTNSATTMATSGAVALQPSATSFTAAQTYPSNLTVASTASSLTFGKPGNTADLTLGNALTIAGPISVYGGNITLNADLTSTLAGAPILLKATSAVIANNTRVFQTNGGAITLWADSDNSGQGFILLNPQATPGSTTLDSRTAAHRTAGTYDTATGGGKITLAGGADDGSGAPAGYAISTSSTTDRGGVNFGDGTTGGHNNNTLIYSGGGDVLVRGKSGNGTMGINWVDSGVINAGGTGLISLDGVNTSTGHGIEFSAYPVNGSTSVVLRSGGGTASTPAIAVSGNTSSSGGNNGVQGSRVSMIATGAGGIAVTGRAVGSGAFGVASPTLDLLAASGPITVDGGVKGISYGGNLGAKAATAVTSSSSPVTFTGDAVQFNSASTVTTTGALTVQPTSASFGSTLTWPLSNLTLGSGVSGLTLGKAGNTAGITVTTAQTIAGPISIYGGDIALNANLTSTLAGAPILVKASNTITAAASTSFQTNNGNITFWADSDASGAGAIALGNSTTFNSAAGSITQQIGGGKITLAGGLDSNADNIPDGYAVSSGNGLAFGTANTSSSALYSGGGDVLVNGKTTATSGLNLGVIANGALAISSGQGAIAINGQSAASYALQFSSGLSSGTGLTLNSAKPTGTAIAITGTTTGNTAHGIVFDYDAVENILATGGGGISITGTAGTGGYGVWMQNTNVLATSGAINIDGGTGGIRVASGPAGSTIGKLASSAVTSSSSNVTLNGDTLSFGATTTVDTTGAVTLQPVSASFGSTQTLSSTIVVGSGATALTIGKTTNTSGIVLTGPQSIAGPISVYGGDISVNANLTSTAAGAAVLAKASGNITSAASVVTNGGNVTLWADSDGNGAGGIQLRNNAAIDTRTAADRTASTNTSGGGRIVLAGGLDDGGTAAGLTGLTASDGSPDGWAINHSGITGSSVGLMLGNDVVTEQNTGIVIRSGGGDITLRGRATSSTQTANGVQGFQNYQVDAGSGGNVTLLGSATTTGVQEAHGLDLFAYRSTSAALGSSSITTRGTGNLTLNGSASGGSVKNVAVGLEGDGVDRMVVQATGSGSVSITGNAGSATTQNAVRLTGADVLAASNASGGISIIGTAGGIESAGSSVHIGSKAGSAVTAASSNLLLRADTVAVSSGTLNAATTDTVVVEPYSASFSAAQTLPAGFSVASTVSGLTYGKPGNTADLTISGAQTVAGPISIYGGNINLNASLTSTAVGAGILVKASNDISTGASTTFQTNLGNITFWSDSDASGAGAITLGNNATLNSAGGSTALQAGGGKVTLAGGADNNADSMPDGFATSASGNGVTFGAVSSATNTVVSGGGDVWVAGKANATSGVVSGIATKGLLNINSGQGAIGISAQSASPYGVDFGFGVTLTSAKTSGSAIAINGITGIVNGYPGAYGVSFGNTGQNNVLATGGGDITITGTAAAGGGVGVLLRKTNVLATSGAITVNGDQHILFAGSGSTIGKSSTGVTASSSNVTLNAGDLSFNVPTTVDTTGTVTLQPSGGSFAAEQILSGNLTVAGTATGFNYGKPGNTANLNLTAPRVVAGPINVWGGNISVATTLNATAGDVLLQASGTLTLASGAVARADDGNVTATTARWVNPAGSTALVAGGSGHQWQVWSSNPDPFNATTGDTRGGLAFDYKQYGATYGSITVLGSGNGLLYSVQPNVTVSLAGSVSKAYDGGTTAALLNSNYSFSGAVDSDQLLLGAPSSSVFASKHVGNNLNVTASGLSLASTLSSSATGSKPVYGYLLANTSATSAMGSITPKALTATVTAPNKVYDGSTAASPTLTITSGLVGSETLGVFGTGSFNSKYVATANLVTVLLTSLANGSNGGMAGNYSLAAGQTVAAAITPKALTATVAAPNKVYDGSTAASPTLTIASGLVGSETVGASGTASFNSKDVATANIVTVNSTSLADGNNGGLASNYSLAAGQTVAAAITPKSLTATVAAPNKVYDGSTTANPTLTISAGLVGSETVDASGTASFNSKDVATANLVTVNSTSLADGSNGGLASNYSLAAGQTVAAFITPQALTATVAAPNKVYDGSTTASPTLAITAGLVGSETVDASGSASFNSKDVATANTVTVTGTSLADGANGGLASNYSLAAGQTVAVSITPKALTATVSAPNKVYDGNTTASPTLSVAGLLGSETLSVSASASFNSKDVATANTVTVTGTSLADGANGGLAGNYSLAAGQAVAASITPKALSATAAAPDKVYDGNATASPTLTISAGLLGSETLSVSASASFNSKDVATANTVTVNATQLADGANGGLASNYSLAAGQTVAAAITPKALTASVTAPNKVYDGSTAASPVLTITAGLVGNETVDASGSASFNSKDVATANTVTVTATSLADGTNGGLASNYSLAAGQAVAAWITPKSLGATVAATNKVYDGIATASPTLTISAGLLGSETLSVSGSASFNSKDVATANTVTVTSTQLADGANGGLASNYSLAAGQTVAASITPKALTANLRVPDKVYDGSTAASPVLDISGLVGSETLVASASGSFNSKDVATANLVTTTTQLADGSNGGLAGNYSLASGQTVAASITPRALTATVAAASKVYDGTTTASPTLTITSGLVGSESLGASGTASFNSKDVATANAVTVTGTTLADGSNGGLAGNYSLASGQTAAAAITPKALTASLAVPGKVYDGSASASPTLTISAGLVGSETVVASGTASFNSKDVATANTVTVTGTQLADGRNGGLGSNYSLVSGQTAAAFIVPRPLTAALGAPDKVYDGSTTASPTLTVTAGLVGSETVDASATANFNSKDVATAHTVTVTSTALADGSNGGLASNYTLGSGQTVAAFITPKALTATVAAPSKVYDGTATASPTLRITGLVGSESLNVSGSASFNSKDVATANTVTVTGTLLADGTNGGTNGGTGGGTGGLASNYSLASGQTVAAAITPLTVAVRGVAANDKVYDASPLATLAGTASVGVLAGDAAALAGTPLVQFADKNVGNGKAVTVSGYALAGADATNYALQQPAGLAASITPAAVQVSGLVAQNKVYDGTATAVLRGTATVAALGSDQLVLAGGGSATFADKNAGTAQPVAAGGYTLTGADAGNYLLLQPAGLVASITPATLSVSGSKVYDGSTQIAGSQLAASGVAGESFVIDGSGAAGNLATRHVGSGLALAGADGLALGAGSNGALARNYLPLAQAQGRIDVTPRPVTLGAAPVDKVYDGSTFADTTAAVVAGSLAAGDGMSGGRFAFADANAGSGKVVTTAGVGVDDGNHGLNYSVAYAANQAVGRITPAPLTVTANDDAKFVTRPDNAGYNGVHYTGFVNGETPGVLGGSVSIARLGGVEAAGLQTGVLVPSGLNAANYEIRYANGSFTIVPAGQLLVRVANQTMTYGDPAAGYTVQSAQYLDGNNVIQTLSPSSTPLVGNTVHFDDGASGQATFTLGPVAGATSSAGLLKAGSYAVGASNVSETSPNFSDTLTVVGQHTVDPRLLQPVLAGGARKVYDGSTAIGPLQVGLPGAVAGDQLRADGVGSYDSRNAGAQVGYSVSRVTLAGADAANYLVAGGGTFSGNDGVITPKVVTLAAPVVSKVYDGQTAYVTTAADLAALSAQLGVNGDAVRGAQLQFADKNVGSAKAVTMTGALVNDGNGGANYVLNFTGSSAGTITRLGSVTWTGGTSGNWFDPANWAGGAVPDLGNVAQVVIPAGVQVVFDSSVLVAPAERGAVFVDAIGSGGALQMQGGTLNVGPGGVQLGALQQSGGSLAVQGDVVLQTFAQTGGSSTVGGNFTATQGYTQGMQGALAVQGRADITAPLGDVVLGTLRANGGLGVVTGGGSIRQAPGTALRVAGAAALDAGSGDIVLGNEGNDFVGPVSARGADVTLRDANALTLGSVTTTGNLNLASSGRLDLGRSTVGGALRATTNGGDIVQQGPLRVTGSSTLDTTPGPDAPAGTAAGDVRLDADGNDFVGTVSAHAGQLTLRDSNALTLGTVVTTGDMRLTSDGRLDLGRSTVGGALTASSQGGDIVQQGPLSVNGNSTLNAGTGAVRLTDAGNLLTGTVNLTAQAVQLVGSASYSASHNWLVPPAPAAATRPLPQATLALDGSAVFELRVDVVQFSTGVLGFAATLPAATSGRLSGDEEPVLSQADGQPLPAWLQFDPATLSLRAEGMPEGRLPLTLALRIGGGRMLIRVRAATAATAETTATVKAAAAR